MKVDDLSRTESRIKGRYQTTIPKIIREQANLNEGDELIWVYDRMRNQIIVKPKPKRFTDALVGLGKELFEKETGDEYIRKERESWD